MEAAPFSYRRMPRLVFLMRRLSRANYEREMELLDRLCDRNRPSIRVRDVHWMKHEIENFIAIHRSRPDVLERLTERIANRRPAR
jgi:hypothetical protein